MHTVPEITSLAAFTRAQPSGNVALGSDARTHTNTHLRQGEKTRPLVCRYYSVESRKKKKKTFEKDARVHTPPVKHRKHESQRISALYFAYRAEYAHQSALILARCNPGPILLPDVVPFLSWQREKRICGLNYADDGS